MGGAGCMPIDAGIDAGTDAGRDAGIDAGRDAGACCPGQVCCMSGTTWCCDLGETCGGLSGSCLGTMTMDSGVP